jgi:hypothetical protein
MTEDTQRSAQKQRPLTLADLDGRTNAAKIARQMIADLVSDLGGADALSTAQRTLAQRAAVTAAMLENMETGWLSGQGLDASAYVALTNSLHKLLTSLGLKRQMREVETLEGYLAAKAAPSPAAEPKARWSPEEKAKMDARAAKAREAQKSKRAAQQKPADPPRPPPYVPAPAPSIVPPIEPPPPTRSN